MRTWATILVWLLLGPAGSWRRAFAETTAVMAVWCVFGYVTMYHLGWVWWVSLLMYLPAYQVCWIAWHRWRKRRKPV